MPAVLAGVLALTLATSCVLTSRRLPRGGAAALMGVAVGTVHACGAALIKSCTNVATSGLVALLTSWQLYLFLLAGGAGLLLTQLAFQAGPLSASLPAITTVDPLLSVVIGVWVYDERLKAGPGSVVTEVLLPGPAVGRGRPAQPGAGRRGAARREPPAPMAPGRPFSQRDRSPAQSLTCGGATPCAPSAPPPPWR